jgi:hypothetical protein
MIEYKEITSLDDIDIEKLLNVCYACLFTMQGEYPEKVTYNKEVMFDTIKRHVESKNHCLIVAYESGNIVAVTSAVIVSYPHSQQLRGHVNFLYILPGYRNGEFGSEMITKIEEWAVSKNAVEVTAGDVGIDLKRNENVFSNSVWNNRGCWYTKKF